VIVGLNGEFVQIAQLGANHLSKSSAGTGKLRDSAPKDGKSGVKPAVNL